MSRAFPGTTPSAAPYREGLAVLTRYAPLVGRILLASLFLMSGVLKLTDWNTMAGYMASKGMPMVNVLLPLAALIELAGGLSILCGCYARIAALALALYLIPATFIFHDFWTLSDPLARANQMMHFMKNLATMGGLLMIAGLGPGPISFDENSPRTSPLGPLSR